MTYTDNRNSTRKTKPGAGRDRNAGRPRLVLIVGVEPGPYRPEPLPRVTPGRDRAKRCSNTEHNEWLPIECFKRDPKSPDGRERECKFCRSLRRGELERGASRCKPWQRRKLAKCGA